MALTEQSPLHVSISKLNESFIRIVAEPSVLMEINEHFRFRPQGYQFSPKYRAKIWDGWIYLFKLSNQTLPSGLYKKLLELCETRGFSYEVSGDGFSSLVGSEENISLDDVKEYMDSLQLASKGKLLEIRDYQPECVYLALREKAGLFLSATSSGKSMMIYTICRYLMETDKKILLIVPTIGLTTQMAKDFIDYSSLNEYPIEDDIHIISGGKEKHSTKSLFVSTWQSVYKLSPQYFQQFDVIICDEAHKLSADSIKGIFEKSTNAEYRMGFTGTIQDAKCHALVLQGLTGTIHQIVTAKQLMESGHASELDIKVVVLNYPEEVRKAFKKADYDDEIKYIVTNERRNKFIAKLADQLEGTTLVLFRFVELQGEVLCNLLKEKSSKKVFYIHGGTSPEERELVRTIAEKEEILIVASLGTFAAGVNIPSIKNLIFGHPSKSKITNLQSVGRLIRLFGDNKVKLYDIADNISYRKRINHSYGHLTERIKNYTTEGFKFSITNIEF